VKSFAWSYSKIKNYRTCPKRYYHVDVTKDFKEEESEQLRFGNQLHDAFHKRLKSKLPLPASFAKYEEWAAKMEKGVTPEVKLLVEQKYALTRDLKATTYFAKDVWYRGIADVVKLAGPVALAVDWKTGKMLDDSVQLALMAQCIFAHYPEVEKVRTEFVWLAEDATTREDFERADMVGLWNNLLPEVSTLEQAHASLNFPANPGRLCRRWCPVRTCPHHGT
jgi:PD-(D/E)XK nuclease superfamily